MKSWPGLLCGAIALVFAATAHAQSYPNQTIRIVVPVAAGGLTDIVGRIIGQELSRRVGQPVVIENKGGGAGIVGTESVVRAKPDGYTILLAYPGVATVNPVIYDNLPYDPIRDLEPVSLVAAYPMVLAAHPSVPATNVAEFIAYARANPGKLNYGSAGIGTTSHLAMELLKQTAGLDLVHVPFRGAAPAMTELLAGRLSATFDSPALVLPQAQTGSLRALGISAASPSELTPGLPTVASGGASGFDITGWYAILVPAGTPKEIIERLSKELQAVVHDPETRRALIGRGVEALGTGPDELRALMRSEIEKWRGLVKSAGLKPQ